MTESPILISTRDLSSFPCISFLRNRLQQMSAIESVLALDEGETVFEFHPEWDHSEQMGAIKNGSGDELFAHFTRFGGCLIGFDHESAMSPYRTKPPKPWPGLLSSIPGEFKPTLDEPAFDIKSTTFAIWRRSEDDAWHTDDLEHPNDSYGDGSQELLPLAILTAVEFAEWILENYEVDVDIKVINHVFEHLPISESQMSMLNPNASRKKLRKAVVQTGFPVE